MHAGFGAIREAMSCNIRRRLEREQDWNANVRADLKQLFALWERALGKYGGPFLFGQRSIADAMYAPVCTRLRTYAVTMPDFGRAYCDTIFADAAFQEWERAAEAEPWTIEQSEALYR
jgi:glutathione S-transferase